MSAFPRVWVFCDHRRVYRRNALGRPVGAPIWREHWVEIEIVGETTRSWITRCGQKIPKKGGQNVVFSEKELDRKVWVHDHGYKISHAVSKITDYETLQKIAGIIGYEEDETK